MKAEWRAPLLTRRISLETIIETNYQKRYAVGKFSNLLLCVCLCMCAWEYVYVYINIYISVCVCVYIYICVCICIYMYLCVCVYDLVQGGSGIEPRPADL